MTESGFLRWWLDQLASLVPARLSLPWSANNGSLTIEIDQQALTVIPPRAKEGIAIELATGGAGGDENPALRARVPKDLNAVNVRLAPHEFLLRRFPLPVAARPHLRDAVGFQLPKVTPFTASQVYYACGIDRDVPSSDDLVNVWVVAVPRRRVLAALQALGLEEPETPPGISHPPAAGEWLDFTWRVSQKNVASQTRHRLLWVGAGILCILAAGLHLYNRQATRDSLSETLSDLRRQSAEVAGIRERLAETSARVDWMNEAKNASVSTLDVLDVLTRELEDDTWLQNLEVTREKVSLQGLSPAPAGLIEKLEGAPILHDVRFESAITQDPRNSGSRFSISAKLRSAVDGSGS